MGQARKAFVIAALVSISGLARAGGVSRVEGTDYGPSVESVTAVFEDRAGFLWIGSRDGLALYDGYATVMFEHDVADPSSIADNNIRTVYEDAAGAIWVGTNTAGLDRLDRGSLKFTHYRHDSQNPRSLPNDSVYAVREAVDGKLWVGTQGGLARLDPAEGTFERFPAGAGGPGSDYIVTLRLDADGTLWICTANGGLSRRDPTSGVFETFRHAPADASSISGDGVYAIAEDAAGSLWLATEAGASRLDRGARTFRTVPFAGFPERQQPLVTTIDVDRDGAVWAGTLDSGLFQLDEDGRAFHPRPFRTARSTDSHARIVTSLADRDGNLWLGTWSEGLGRVSRRSRVFTAAPDARSPGEVESVLADARGRVWIGLLDNTVNLFAPGAPPRRVPVRGYPLSLLDTREGLWVGLTDGLMLFDEVHGRIRDFRHRPADAGSIGGGWVWALCRDHEGRLWVGTGEGGLNRLRDDGTFDRFTHDPANPHSLSDDYVTAIGEDARGTLWVGTRSGGLDAFDRATARFRRYTPDAGDPSSLSHHNVTSILSSRSGALWVGTAGGGINRARRDASGAVTGFDRFTEADGLIGNNVVSLQEDDDGSLWIGTRRGLSRFDPDTRRFVNYGTEDGLASAELTLGAAAAGPSAFYFGTHRGLVAVRRGTPFPELGASPTAVTAIRTIGSTAPVERPAPVDVDVEIPWRRILSLEFAVLDFGDRRRHRYAYRISGRQDDWVELGSRRELTFTDLDPGRYELFVRGRNDQGIWSETATPVRIRVVPPFWMTGWFRAVALASLAGLVLAVHRLRTASLEKRNRELLVLKEQREAALDEVRASQDALNQTYGRLRGLTRRLEAAKEDERKRIARELHDEMGQILTTAKLNLQLIASAGETDERARRVGDAIGLLDRLIGHVRALSLDLRPPLLDELGLSAALRGYLESQRRRSGLTIDLAADSVPPGIPADVEIAAFRVVQEAITNVLRHARATTVAVELRYDPGRLELRIVDDGRGFDVTEAMEHAASGGHLGLLGMRERVEAMGGSMTITSAPGRGTEVRAHIPWEK